MSTRPDNSALAKQRMFMLPIWLQSSLNNINKTCKPHGYKLGVGLSKTNTGVVFLTVVGKSKLPKLEYETRLDMFKAIFDSIGEPTPVIFKDELLNLIIVSNTNLEQLYKDITAELKLFGITILKLE